MTQLFSYFGRPPSHVQGASAVAAGLAEVPDDELIDALAVIVSKRPSFHAALCELAAQEPSPRRIGTITHFYPDKQYGFIKCDEVKEAYGLDTFLSNLELGPFAVGSTVSFTLVVNKDGKPQARLLRAGPNQWRQRQPGPFNRLL